MTRATPPGRRRPPLQAILLLVIGAVFGSLGTLTWTAGPDVRVVDAVVEEVDPLGDAVLLAAPSDLAGQAFGVIGAHWRVGEGPWQRGRTPDGWPTCVEPGGRDLEVTLGLVEVEGGGGRPDITTVAWLECRPEGDG